MPKRILVLINTLNVGGAETFLMKVLRTMNRDNFIFDFLINDRAKGAYEDEVLSLGGKVYHGYFKVQNPIKNLYNIYSTVKKGAYKDVFVVTQHPIAFLDLLMTLFGGATNRVVRSTNADCGGRISHIIAAFSRPFINMLTCVRVAPSKEAAEWLFGKDMIKKKGFHQLNNGLDLSMFTYSKDARNKFRAELGIANKTVIGHVGRFNRQKNHLFLIDVYAEYKKINPESVLVLIGKGETENIVKDKIAECGLQDSVILTGVRSDIPSCLSGFDCFLFPSLYEGMPNTVIEAQATGLPCVLSDSITRDAEITDLLKYISLTDNPRNWALSIKASLRRTSDRFQYHLTLKQRGYSITDVTNEVQYLFSR